jgi:hypothetical protein
MTKRQEGKFFHTSSSSSVSAMRSVRGPSQRRRFADASPIPLLPPMITTSPPASFCGIGHPLRSARRVSATANRWRHTILRFAFRITIRGESSDPVSIRLPDATTHFMMRRTLCIMRGASREFRHRHSEKLQQAFPERAQRPTFQECLSASAVSESRFATWAALEADSKSSTYEDEVIL